MLNDSWFAPLVKKFHDVKGKAAPPVMRNLMTSHPTQLQSKVVVSWCLSYPSSKPRSSCFYSVRDPQAFLLALLRTGGCFHTSITSTHAAFVSESSLNGVRGTFNNRRESRSRVSRVNPPALFSVASSHACIVYHNSTDAIKRSNKFPKIDRGRPSSTVVNSFSSGSLVFTPLAHPRPRQCTPNPHKYPKQ